MEPTIGVCGFGRCGSTMVMAMLNAGGCPPVAGSHSGTFEVANVAAALQSPFALPGHAVKLLDAVLWDWLPSSPEWRFVWVDRDPTQQARSMVKFASLIMGRPLEPGAEQVFAASYTADRPVALAGLKRLGPVLVLRYEDVLADPLKAARALRRFWPTLDTIAAAAVVHDRTGECRPDLAVERSLATS